MAAALARGCLCFGFRSPRHACNSGCDDQAVMFGPSWVAPAGNPVIHFDFLRRNPAADPARDNPPIRESKRGPKPALASPPTSMLRLPTFNESPSNYTMGHERPFTTVHFFDRLCQLCVSVNNGEIAVLSPIIPVEIWSAVRKSHHYTAQPPRTTLLRMRGA